MKTSVLPLAALIALVSASSTLDAQQTFFDRLPAAVLDIVPPSERVRGAPGEMRIQPAACSTLPIDGARRRIVDVAVQEWGFFRFNVVDETIDTSPWTPAPRAWQPRRIGEGRGFDRRVLGGHSRGLLDRRESKRRMERTPGHRLEVARSVVGGIHILGDVRREGSATPTSSGAPSHTAPTSTRPSARAIRALPRRRLSPTMSAKSESSPATCCVLPAGRAIETSPNGGNRWERAPEPIVTLW